MSKIVFWGYGPEGEYWRAPNGETRRIEPVSYYIERLLPEQVTMLTLYAFFHDAKEDTGLAIGSADRSGLSDLEVKERHAHYLNLPQKGPVPIQRGHLGKFHAVWIVDEGTPQERLVHERFFLVTELSRVKARRKAQAVLVEPPAPGLFLWGSQAAGLWHACGDRDDKIGGMIDYRNAEEYLKRIRCRGLTEGSMTVRLRHIEHAGVDRAYFKAWNVLLSDFYEGRSPLAQDQLLSRNLRLILSHSQEILDKPEYFYCKLGSAYLSASFIVGGPMPLGVLLLLWREGKLLDTCTGCGGTVHIIGTGGSILSGDHSWWGYCRECGEGRRGHKEHFHELWHPILEMLREHRNEAVVQPGKRRRFSWLKGLIGEDTPDRIIKPRVEEVDIATLVRELKRRDGDAGDSA